MYTCGNHWSTGELGEGFSLVRKPEPKLIICWRFYRLSVELKCSEYKLLQMKKDFLGIHNSITYESLVTRKLLRKAVHELRVCPLFLWGFILFSFAWVHSKRLQVGKKAIMNTAKWWTKVKMSIQISVHNSMSVF